MRRYIRQRHAGGRFFFTVVTYGRRPLLTQPENLPHLRGAFRAVMDLHPFTIEAMVVLPDHLHCIWRLPEGDDDFPMRWAQIKRRFSLRLLGGEAVCPSRSRRRERTVWQRRYWEHALRSDADYARHVEYIHYNPVKHGYVTAPAAWPHSSFIRFVVRGLYPADWGAGGLLLPPDVGRE